MAAVLLLSAFTEIWPFLVPFVSAILSAAVGYGVATITFRRTEASKQSQETVNEKKAWRDGVTTRLADAKAAIEQENKDRIFWQLENAADWERVVSILKEFGEVQRLLAVVATTSQHHAAEIAALNRRMDESTKHLNDFIMRHVNVKAAS